MQPQNIDITSNQQRTVIDPTMNYDHDVKEPKAKVQQIVQLQPVLKRQIEHEVELQRIMLEKIRIINTVAVLPDSNMDENLHNTDVALPNNTHVVLPGSNTDEGLHNTNVILLDNNMNEELHNTYGAIQESNTSGKLRNTNAVLPDRNTAEEPNNTDMVLLVLHRNANFK